MPKVQMAQELHHEVKPVAAAMRVAVNTSLATRPLSFLLETERWAHNLWLYLETCGAQC